MMYTSTGINSNVKSLEFCHATNILYFTRKKSAYIIKNVMKYAMEVINIQHEISIIKTLPKILILGTVDGFLYLYKIDEKNTQIKSMKIHNSKICALDAICVEDNLFVASSSIDSDIKIISLNSTEEYILLNSQQYDITLSLKFNPFGVNNILLMAGTSDNKIKLFKICLKTNSAILLYGSFFHGHTDWIRSIDILSYKDNLLVLSGAQDCTIKIWKLQNSTAHMPNENEYIVDIESTLQAHKNWIYHVEWCRFQNNEHNLSFMSVSLDETIILWLYDQNENIWFEGNRIGTSKGIGYLGACWFTTPLKANKKGEAMFKEHVISYSVKGSFFAWEKIVNPNTNNNGPLSSSIWNDAFFITGHTDSVVDLCWMHDLDTFNHGQDLNGWSLLTTSKDQTTRLHSEINLPSGHKTWAEIARCQIHGYDLNCITLLDALRFASGANEKIVRIFEAPKSFIHNYGKWKRKSFFSNQENDGDHLITKNDLYDSLSDVACNAPLDLTNLPIIDGTLEDNTEKRNIARIAYTIPETPTENYLYQSTLWIEKQKLYGHGNEISALAFNPIHNILASACKATNAQFANIYIWDCSDPHYKLIRKFDENQAHTLTVTRMCFHPLGKYLLSVSRDRTWNVYQAVLNDKDKVFDYQRIDSSGGKTPNHNRIVWDCRWFPASTHQDSYTFITCSRDKKAIVWKFNHSNDKPQWFTNKSLVVVSSSSVNAVDVAHYKKDCFIILLGLESGVIACYTIISNAQSQEVINYQFNLDHKHGEAINRISLKPNNMDSVNDKENKHQLTLASCSMDGSVFIQNINLANIINQLQ